MAEGECGAEDGGAGDGVDWSSGQERGREEGRE